MDKILAILVITFYVVKLSSQVPQRNEILSDGIDEYGDPCPKCQMDLASRINRLEEKIDAHEDQLRTQLDKVVTSLENLMTTTDQFNEKLSGISSKAEDIPSLPSMMVKAMESLVNKLDSNRDKPLKVVLTKESIPETCPAPFELEGGSCLHFVLEGLTWAKAKDNCEALAPGASLVMPMTESKIKDFKNYIKKNGIATPGFVWLGAEENTTNGGKWHWIDETEVNFGRSLTWASGEPNDYKYSFNEDCLDYSLTHKGLNDDNCEDTLSSICEVPPTHCTELEERDVKGIILD